MIFSKNILSFSGFLLLLFMTVLSTSKVFAQVDNSLIYKFNPNWQHGMEFTYYHQQTSLGTNESDMPIYMIVDSLYMVVKVSKTDSQTWVLAIEHFTKYDAKNHKAYKKCNETLKNAPILLEFDTAYNYLGLANWEQWRDTLHKNLRLEFNRKKISLKTYSDFKALYNDPLEVEEVVAYYYLNMFSIYGRSVDLWVYNPMVVDITNPFKESKISKSGEEFFYTRTETPNLMNRSFIAKTDEKLYQELAEDYINYINPSKDQEIGFSKPRVTLKREEFHSFNMKLNFLVEFRFETSVEINGASTFLEYHITILNASIP